MSMANFRMVAFGDSLMWGQGLPRDSTFASVVHKALSGGGAAQGGEAEGLAMRAHSGAVIGYGGRLSVRPALWSRLVFGPREVPDWIKREPGAIGGEISSPTPTVAEQVRAFSDRPEAVRLVLLNGGGNDVGVQWYLSPATSLAALEAAIVRYCGRDMVTLIHRAAERFPNAVIVVPGYMQSLSESSEKRVLAGFFSRLVLTPFVWRSRYLIGRVLERSAFFRRCTARELRASVARVNAELLRREGARFPAGRVLFSDVDDFGPENAANGRNAWVWGLDIEALRPQDPLRDFRRGACTRFGRWSPHYFASVGHPNERGAEEIANGVLRALGNWAIRNRAAGVSDPWALQLCEAAEAAASVLAPSQAAPGQSDTAAPGVEETR